MQDLNCVFCKIIAGDLPAQKVYEDDQMLSIKDIHPFSEGHSVLFSKKHFANTKDLPKDEAGKLFEKAIDIGEELKKKLKADGYNILVSEGEAAQSEVAHRPHIHIIPRKFSDGLRIRVESK